jgi:hypothetical protein
MSHDAAILLEIIFSFAAGFVTCALFVDRARAAERRYSRQWIAASRRFSTPQKHARIIHPHAPGPRTLLALDSLGSGHARWPRD